MAKMVGKIPTDIWFTKNARHLTRLIEIIFGVIWLIDSSFKFQAYFESQFSNLLAAAAQGQPQWLQGWFYWWAALTSSDPHAFAFAIGILELSLGIGLVLGLMRKIAYGGGFVLSMVIWTVPEGFGGPYGPSSTDIGTGAIYAIAFVLLALINALAGRSEYTLDSFLSKKIKWWKKLADIKY
jgi:uncharacterized membrane protein YphA (DoxX/SURF4 family)